MSRINLSFKQHRRQFFLLITGGLASCVNTVGNQDMINTGKHFKSFSEWGKIRPSVGERTLTINGITEPVIPSMTHASYPVPVYRQKQLQIAFMVCAAAFGPRRLQIWPPDKIGWYDPVSGKQITLTEVSPADFNQKDDIDKMMMVKSNNLTYDEAISLEKRLFALYDILFAAWATKSSTLSRDKLQSAAHEFLKIFDQISEKPLRPYYDALGRDWFGWLRELAG